MTEKQIYATSACMIVIFIVIAAWLMNLPQNRKNKAFAAETESIEDFIEEVTEIKIRPIFEPQSGMPCDNPEQFERWYSEYEQTASKEKVYYPKRIHKPSILAVGEDEVDGVVISAEESSSEVETEGVEYPETSEVPDSKGGSEELCKSQKFQIMGARIDEDLQERLFMVLDDARIPYWYEIAICQLFQESRGERYAVSKDGRDHGILQYRLQYWDEVCRQYGYEGASIYDTDVQLQIYAKQMSKRLNQGLSAEECISRHKTSDEVTAVDWEYVGQVKQHLANLREVK